MNWEVVPQKHTARNTLVATMSQLDFTLEEIRRKFGWVPDSEMPYHYLNYKLDKMPNAIANTLRKLGKQELQVMQERFLNGS